MSNIDIDDVQAPNIPAMLYFIPRYPFHPTGNQAVGAAKRTYRSKVNDVPVLARKVRDTHNGAYVLVAAKPEPSYLSELAVKAARENEDAFKDFRSCEDDARDFLINEMIDSDHTHRGEMDYEQALHYVRRNYGYGL